MIYTCYEICSVHIFSSIVKTRKGVEVPRRFETVESNIVLNQFLPLAQLAAADFPWVGSVSVVLSNLLTGNSSLRDPHSATFTAAIFCSLLSADYVHKQI